MAVMMIVNQRRLAIAQASLWAGRMGCGWGENSGMVINNATTTSEAGHCVDGQEEPKPGQPQAVNEEQSTRVS